MELIIFFCRLYFSAALSTQQMMASPYIPALDVTFLLNQSLSSKFPAQVGEEFTSSPLSAGWTKGGHSTRRAAGGPTPSSGFRAVLR